MIARREIDISIHHGYSNMHMRFKANTTSHRSNLLHNLLITVAWLHSRPCRADSWLRSGGLAWGRMIRPVAIPATYGPSPVDVRTHFASHDFFGDSLEYVATSDPVYQREGRSGRLVELTALHRSATASGYPSCCHIITISEGSGLLYVRTASKIGLKLSRIVTILR